MKTNFFVGIDKIEYFHLKIINPQLSTLFAKMVFYCFDINGETVDLDIVEADFLARLGEEPIRNALLGPRCFQFELLTWGGLACTVVGKFNREKFDELYRGESIEKKAIFLDFLNGKYVFKSWSR